MPPSNRAAYQPAKNAKTLEVKDAPYSPAPANGIVVKVHAVAINPVDWMLQHKGDFMFTWIKYPFIFGNDLAGEVVEVGESVTRFKVGDRVLGHAPGIDPQVNNDTESAFQEYPVLRSDLTSQIPKSMSYESACVIPLGISTAACGMFQKDQLGLSYPTVPPTPSSGKTLIVWGGATSVGCNAIQLGVAAGYEVFTTASPKNFDLVKKLGASQAFDYKSKTVVSDMLKALEGKPTAGAITIGPGAAEACMKILGKLQGNKFIAMVSYPEANPAPTSFVLPRTIFFFLSWIVSFKVKGLIKGVRSNFVFGSTLANNEVGKAIYEDFLPKALEEGTFVPAPEPIVVGKGLESIQDAFEYQRKGVSAQKVVVTL